MAAAFVCGRHRLFLRPTPKTALWRRNEKSAAATKPDALLKKGGKWSHRESNSNLIFRRDLFYPLNYETPQCVCGCKGSQIMC